MNWAALSKASKAVLPVILSHCNAKGLAFPGEQRVAILTGRTEKQAREGINGLRGFPGFRLAYYTTKRGKRGKRYFMKPVQTQGETFPIRTMIIYGGNWSQLRPSAQSLYPVMRHFSYFNVDEYSYQLDEDQYDEIDGDFDEVYATRRFDFCEADYTTLAKYAGIARRSIDAALSSLVKGCLIESDVDNRIWKVFVYPPKRFKPSFLNSQIMKRYRVEKITGNAKKKIPKSEKKLSEC